LSYQQIALAVIGGQGMKLLSFWAFSKAVSDDASNTSSAAAEWMFFCLSISFQELQLPFLEDYTFAYLS